MNDSLASQFTPGREKLCCDEYLSCWLVLLANYSFATNTYFCHWKLLMDFFKVSQPENLTFHCAHRHQSTGRDNGGCLTHSPRVTPL